MQALIVKLQDYEALDLPTAPARLSWLVVADRAGLRHRGQLALSRGLGARECAPLAKAGFVCLLARFGRRMFCANLHWQALEVMLALYRLFLSSASCSAWRGRGRGL